MSGADYVVFGGDFNTNFHQFQMDMQRLGIPQVPVYGAGGTKLRLKDLDACYTNLPITLFTTVDTPFSDHALIIVDCDLTALEREEKPASSNLTTSEGADLKKDLCK